jgi:UDP-glucose 4-epimerase
MTVLVTGGAGFIGSHTCVELLNEGHEVVVVDDYSNSSPAALDAVRQVADGPLVSYEVDLRDRDALRRVFDSHRFDSVIHFAAKKAVGESAQIPVDYYDINIGGTTNLIRAMLDHDVRQLVFSSSCSIYGGQYDAPITEDDLPSPTNPYARTKLICEQILADACARYPDLSVVSLRYFNPVGAHPSGVLGEDPRGVPTNLMPHMMQVAVGRLQKLRVFGLDYPTADGSGVRDYIHVVDVAEAHRVALEHLADMQGMRALNLGTGTGVSVLQLIEAFEEECGVTIPYETVGRRPGDVAMLIADATRIEKEWSWRTTRDIRDACRDAWRFQQGNPDGYR